MKAKINRDACIGCELCVAICPQVFEMDDEQKAIVIVDTIAKEDESQAEQAAASCPTMAITIE